jgi:hypothetical protein
MIFSAVGVPVASGLNGESKLIDDWLTYHADGMPISSNQASMELPFQRWFKIKEAFSPRFIIQCIQNAGREVKHCLDPFGGSGTSALTCQFLGIKPTTIEVNPFLADLIEAKLATYDLSSLRRDLEDVLSIADPHGIRPRSILKHAPPASVQPGTGDRWIFSTRVAQQILALSAGIDCVESANNRRLLRVALGSILLTVSNVIVNGKGRKYRGNWQNRNCTASLVVELFRKRSEEVVIDLQRFASRACCDYKIIRGDSREHLSKIGSIDLAVFSPPYPNSFDYTDIYNLELWMLGYLQNREDNVRLRNHTLRSHVQIKRQFDTLKGSSAKLDRTYDQLVAMRQFLWNRNIPEMVTSYFCDMTSILIQIRAKLRKNARIFMAIGSSKYAGVLVDVPAILIELAPIANLSVVKTAPIRSMRASAQQGGRRQLKEVVLCLERS